MNKKLTNDLLKRRTLVIRREAIVALTSPQLRHVAGAGSGDWWPCRGTEPPQLPDQA